MVGVGYGKGVGLPEDQVRWHTPEEIEAKQQRGERLRFFDARDDNEYAAGTLPGAEHLAQSSLMFKRDAIQPLLDDLLSGAGGADDLIFFANTAGKGNGMTAGRDVYVMAFLLELGLPLERMSRLAGGLHGWQASGRPTPAPSSGSTEAVDGWDGLLATASLPHLRPSLEATALSECVSKLVHESRPALLAHLKEAGLGLADRQALCNAIAKAIREGRLATEELRAPALAE